MHSTISASEHTTAKKQLVLTSSRRLACLSMLLSEAGTSMTSGSSCDKLPESTRDLFEVLLALPCTRTKGPPMLLSLVASDSASVRHSMSLSAFLWCTLCGFDLLMALALGAVPPREDFITLS